MKASISLIWLKRDLRLQDHAALRAAHDQGLPVLLLYVFEPKLRETPTYDLRHERFVWESLQDLQGQLAHYGGK
ncbi:MAG: deoxyribodipyrimidine photo-lyase, partial [Bacteroidota bacterium]